MRVLLVWVLSLALILPLAAQAQLIVVREAIGVAKSSGQLTASVDATLTKVNAEIVNGTHWSLRGDADVIAAVRALLSAPTTQAEASYINAVAAFIAELVGGVPPPPIPPPGGTSVLTEAQMAVVIARVLAAIQTSNLKLRGEVEIHNRLFIGDAIDQGRARGYESAYALQIMSNKSATINGVANLDGTQFQNPAPHFGYFSFNNDGGILAVQNAGYLCSAGVCAGKDFIDPTREISTNGVDSRGTWVYDLREPGKVYGAGDKTQAVWLRPDYERKIMLWAVPRAGYRWELSTSSAATLLDQKFLVPQQ